MGTTGKRTQIDVEKLLQWAYRDELPKKGISSAEGIWDKIAEYGHGGGIDPGHGAAQRYPQFGLPHSDAEEIERAVAKLPDADINWEDEAVAILGELIALVEPRRSGFVSRETGRAGDDRGSLGNWP